MGNECRSVKRMRSWANRRVRRGRTDREKGFIEGMVMEIKKAGEIVPTEGTGGTVVERSLETFGAKGLERIRSGV